MNPNPTVAVLGGTGAEGGGLALRWAQAGLNVVLGSRTAERAQEAAQRLNERLNAAGGPPRASGADNLSAAQRGDIVVLAVPYAAQQATALAVREALAGKVLVDVTVPLRPPQVSRAQLPEGGSAVVALQAALGDSVRVVSAFQNVSAHHLGEGHGAVDCDVLVCGDDEAAREAVVQLAQAAGLRGVHAGALCNSAAAEALTSVLIFINRRHKVPGAGIRITGI